MTGGEELLSFPTDFPIKVMGRDTESFRTLTLAIVERHAGPLPGAVFTAQIARSAPSGA